jgi:hypothetical protein
MASIKPAINVNWQGCYVHAAQDLGVLEANSWCVVRVCGTAAEIIATLNIEIDAHLADQSRLEVDNVLQL